MSFLGNLFHSIANVVDGNSNQKKKQQTQPVQVITPNKTIVSQKTPANNSIVEQPTALQNLNITPLQKAPLVAPVKTVTPVVAPQTIAPPVKTVPVVNKYGGSNAISPLITGAPQPNPIGPDAATGPINFSDVGKANALGVAHVLTSVPEGLSALEDFISPGKGTNRVTKALQGVDKRITTAGQADAAASGDPESFNITQPAAQAATLIGPGDLIKAATGARATLSAAERAAEAAGTSRLVTGAQKAIKAISSVPNFFSHAIPVLQKAVDSKFILPDEAEAATQVADGVHTVNPSRPEDAAAQVAQNAPTPAPVADAAPAVTNPVVDPEVAPTDAAPVAPAPTEPAPVEPAPIPKPTNAPVMAKNAPRVRAVVQKKLDSLAGNAGDVTQHPVFSNKELLDAGTEHANTFNDADLVDQYKNGFTPHGAADVAKGHAALERLNEIIKANPKNVDAQNALDNILEGSEKEISEGGRTVNYAQQFYDGLKGPAKTSYLIRQIDKVREKAGLPLLKDNEDDMAAATKEIQSKVDAEQQNKANVVTMEERLAEIKNAAKEGNATPQLTKEANVLNRQIKAHSLEMSKNTSELVKYYDTLAPRSIALQTKAGDLGRSLMLTSVAGRGNDIATTAINGTHTLLQQTLEATGGKVAGKEAGDLIDTLPSPKAIARGVRFGVKKSVQRFRGNVVDDTATNLLKKANSQSGKAQLLNRNKGFTGGIRRVVRGATEIATDLSEGLKESRIQQLASQEAKKLGLKGDDYKAYTAAATAAPSKEFTAAGDKLQAEVNNMQDNPITNSLDKISKGISSIPVVGEQLRNLTIPFTRWTGGQLHNALVDKNAVVNAGKMIKAMTKGDTQGAITEASKLAVNGVAAISVGYALSKAGLLTHQNAQGYDDDGVYLHVNGRYIPATFLGFFAPGMILGASAHDAMQKNGDGKGNILQTALDTTGNVMKNSYYAYSGSSLTGQDNPVVTSLDNASKNGFGDVGTTAAGQIVSQYIPAFTGDVNSFLNNDGKFDPTHEAALTKVTKGESGTLTKSGKPSQAKDVTKTVENQLINKIPVLSQKLPRETGVAAPDEFDRLTRGDRDTSTELNAKDVAAKKAAVSASDKSAGIPDPNGTYATGDSFTDAVENRVEGGHYDQAIAGLQQQLGKVKAEPDVTTKKTQPIEDQIKQIQVLKSGDYQPAVRELYSSTSVSEWRNMGDPTSADYDPTTYQTLYNYDKDLAAQGISGSSDKKTDPKYTQSTTSAKSSAAAAKKTITSNTLGSTPDFTAPDLSSLSPKKITSAAAQIPTIQEIQPGDLIKKRAISVKTVGS